MVEAVELEKQFGVVRALDKFSLAVHAREILGLVGQNGAGKSTFVKILAGLERADGGTIRVDGEEVKLTSHRTARQLGFTFVHQQLALIPTQTVEENLFLASAAPKRLGLVSRPRARRAAEELLGRFDLSIKPDARIGELSIADRWLVAISKALVQRSRLLVLDEPTASLSAPEAGHLFETIRQLRDDGVAVIYISHRLGEIEEVAERIAVCKDGRVVQTMLPQEATRREVIRMMVGREITDFAIGASTIDPGVPALAAKDISGNGVEEVSFEVHSGEIVGFAGLVGAGRTETAQLLVGHRALAGGKLEAAGRPFKPKTPVDAVRQGIVLVTEDRAESLFATRSIAHNNSIAILRRLRHVSWAPFVSAKQERSMAQERINDLSIKARGPTQMVRELSGGNQQKVVLGRWLSRGADVFIFDEPTRGIDVEGKQQIYLLMDELAKAGAAVIFISSEFPELISISHRMIVFREGRTVAEVPRGTSEEGILQLCYADPEEEHTP